MLLTEEGAKSQAFLVASYKIAGLCPLTQHHKGSKSPSINNTTNLLFEISMTNTTNLWNSLIYVSIDPHCLSYSNFLNNNSRSLVSNLSMRYLVNSSRLPCLGDTTHVPIHPSE